MITGGILIAISLTAFYYIYKTDLEEVVTENETLGKLKIYIGIIIVFIIGIVSILNNS